MRISVIIPVYNGERFITESLDSALNQTLRPFEIIVVNDGSTDGTETIVERYIKQFGDIIHYIYQINKGISGAYNTGIAAAHGECIAFLEQDDLWEIDKLEKQTRFLEKNPDCAMVYTPVNILREGNVSKVKARFDKKPTKHKYDFADFIVKNRVRNCSSVLLRKSALEEVGGFNEVLRLAFDYDLWLRLLVNHAICVIEEPLTIYRVHENNFSKDEHDLMAAENTVMVLMKWYKQSQIKQKVGKKVFQQRFKSLRNAIAWQHMKNDNDVGIRETYWSYLKVDPFDLSAWGQLFWFSLGRKIRRNLQYFASRLRRLFA